MNDSGHGGPVVEKLLRDTVEKLLSLNDHKGSVRLQGNKQSTVSSSMLLASPEAPEPRLQWRVKREIFIGINMFFIVVVDFRFHYIYM